MDQPAASVVIPTRGRPTLLSACLESLASGGSEPPPFEVVVALDGPDEPSRRATEAFRDRLNVTVVSGPRGGVAAVRNRAIDAARGPVIIMLNDDVRPGPGFVAAHLRAQGVRPAGDPALVLGYSPFAVPHDETLFERLVRETSMVFFYDRMIDPAGRLLGEPGRDWGFRHAWTLNLSASRECLVRAGGFRPALANCCFEDLELAWRLAGSRSVPVLFHPEARAPHHHRFTPDGYLEREWRLGYSAHGFALAAPECAGALFGRDLRDPLEIEAIRARTGPGGGAEARLIEEFRGLAERPAGAIGSGAPARAAAAALYEQHLPLKRSAWRRGFLAACDGERVEGLFHDTDGLPAAPGFAPGAAA